MNGERLLSEPCARCTCTVAYTVGSLDVEGLAPLICSVLPPSAVVGFAVRVEGGKHWFRPVVFCSDECADASDAADHIRAQLQIRRRRRFMLKFRCPQCNGAEFGSSGLPPLLERICHATVWDARGFWRGCGFSWSESDDWRYFVRSFSDPESYAAARDEEMPRVAVARSIEPGEA